MHLELNTRLVRAGHTVDWAPNFFSPAELDKASIETVNKLISTRIRAALEHAEAMVVILDCIRFDDGTPWEMGYAAARNLPVYALTTDVLRIHTDTVLSVGNILQAATITETAHTLDELLRLING